MPCLQQSLGSRSFFSFFPPSSQPSLLPPLPFHSFLCLLVFFPSLLFPSISRFGFFPSTFTAPQVSQGQKTLLTLVQHLRLSAEFEKGCETKAIAPHSTVFSSFCALGSEFTVLVFLNLSGPPVRTILSVSLIVAFWSHVTKYCLFPAAQQSIIMWTEILKSLRNKSNR